MEHVLDNLIFKNGEDETQDKPREYQVKVSSKAFGFIHSSVIIGETYSKKLAAVFGISDYIMRDIIRGIVYQHRVHSFGPYTKDIADTLADRAQEIEGRYFGHIRLLFQVS